MIQQQPMTTKKVCPPKDVRIKAVFKPNFVVEEEKPGVVRKEYVTNDAIRVEKLRHRFDKFVATSP